MGACSHALLHFLRERRRRGDKDGGRRCWRSFVFHTCFTHTHTHTRTSNTQSYPHTHTNKKKRLEVCVILLLGQLEATFLGNCQLPQYFNYGLSACVCAHNSICWPNWEGHRERRREGEHTPARGFVRLVASRATIGRSPTTTNKAHSLAIILSRPLALSLYLSYYRLELFINKRSTVSRKMWAQQNIQNLQLKANM